MKKIIMAVFLVYPAFVFAADENKEAVSQEYLAQGEEDQGVVMLQDSEDDVKSFVEDYIKKDVALKGAFFIEDKTGKILKLKYISIIKVETAQDFKRNISVNFSDANDKIFEVFFSVSGSNWGNLDIVSVKIKEPVLKEKPIVQDKNKTPAVPAVKEGKK